ncbi:MAG TPA: hypothetical protein VI431_14375 [Candidatus Acidoferrum sp.]
MSRSLQILKSFLLLLSLIVPTARAQSYQTGTVVQLLFIRSAKKQHSEWRYLIRVNEKTVYEITRHRGGDMEIQNKATVQYRLENHHMYILGPNKKETRFEIIDDK